MKQMVKNWKQLEDLEDKIIGTKDGNIKIGKNLEVDGNLKVNTNAEIDGKLKLNSANDLVDKEGHTLISSVPAQTKLYRHEIYIGQGTTFDIINKRSTKYNNYNELKNDILNIDSGEMHSLENFNGTKCLKAILKAVVANGTVTITGYLWRVKLDTSTPVECKSYDITSRFEYDTVTEYEG